MLLSNPGVFDIPLAETVLDFVQAHPELHNQKYGNMCIIGYVMYFGGDSWAPLGLRPIEWLNIFNELDNTIAIAKLQNYIDQARVYNILKDLRELIDA